MSGPQSPHTNPEIMRGSAVGSSLRSMSSIASRADARRSSSLGGEDQLLGAAGQEAGVAGGVVPVGDRDGRFERGQLLVVHRSGRRETPVVGQGGSHEHVVRAGPFGHGGGIEEGAVRGGVAGSALGFAQPHHELGPLGVGNLPRRRVGEGLLVPGGRLGGSEVLGGVVGGGHRPPLGGGEVAGEGRVPGEVDDGVRARVPRRGAAARARPARGAAAGDWPGARSRARGRPARA